MKRGSTQAGFTIFETLIVLAVSAALFTMVALTMSGSQNKAQFLQATQNLQSRIQQIISDVPNGFFPNTGNVQCSASAAGVIINSASQEQGTNQDCVFLGKVVQFHIQGTDPEQINTYSIAGWRQATTVAAAKPIVVNVPGAIDTTLMNYGLTSKSLTYGGIPIGAFGIISEMGSLNAAGSYESGNQRVDLVPIMSSNLNVTTGSSVSTINSNLAASMANSNPPGGILLCVQSGTTSQTALITIGSDGHDLAVESEVKPC